MYLELFELHEKVSKTLANQKRLEIVNLLKNKELTVTEMVEMLGIRQANLSQHLSILRGAKVVETKRVGNRIFYKIADERLSKANDLIRSFLIEAYKLDDKIVEVVDSEEDFYPVVSDPVCGMRFSFADAHSSLRFNGEVFYFCAAGCMKKFTNNSKRFVKSRIKEKVLI